jgi:hypothetical protein
MNVKLIVKNGTVYEKRMFKEDKAVGLIIDGLLTLDEDYKKKLLEKKATVTIEYSYIAPKKEFRRRF